MRKLLRQSLAAVIGITSVAGFGFIGGCEIDHHHHYEHGYNRTVYVEPGWYYDKEYYEPGGRFHDRSYYYWDGHRWDHRDRLPSGLTARERRHDEHLAHLDHLDHVDRD